MRDGENPGTLINELPVFRTLLYMELLPKWPKPGQC